MNTNRKMRQKIVAHRAHKVMYIITCSFKVKLMTPYVFVKL